MATDQENPEQPEQPQQDTPRAAPAYLELLKLETGPPMEDFMEAKERNDWLLPFLDVILLLLAVLLMMYMTQDFTRSKNRPLRNEQHASRSVDAPVPEKVPVAQDQRQSLIKALEDLVKDFERDNELKLKVGDQEINLSINESVLFDTGDATLKPEGIELIRRILPALNKDSYRIVVEGYADDRPISNLRYPSNWELSAARAASVARFMIQEGIDADRLQITGYGETRPIAQNDTEEGRRLNRRVNLVLRVAAQNSAPQ
jgi:chemotaxis protein MotB